MRNQTVARLALCWMVAGCGDAPGVDRHDPVAERGEGPSFTPPQAEPIPAPAPSGEPTPEVEDAPKTPDVVPPAAEMNDRPGPAPSPEPDPTHLAGRCASLAPGLYGDPSMRGPHPVGVRTVEIADPARPGRTLVTEIWYPADPAAPTSPKVTYGLSNGDLAALAGDDSGGYFALLGMTAGDSSLLEIVETDAVRDVAMAAPDPSRGLVLFSHGFRGIRYQSTFLTVWLASHGYVVAAPDHQGNTLTDGSEEAAVSAVNRVEDILFLTDELVARNQAPGEFLHQAFDARRIAWTGHSFGASMSIMAGALDGREVVVVPLGPAFDERMAVVYDPPSYDLDAALFIIGGTADTTTPPADQQLAYDRTAAPRFSLQLDGMRHMDMTDLCGNELLRFAFDNFVDELSDACGDSPAVYHATLQTMVTAVLGRYLACNDDASPHLAPSWVQGLPAVSQYLADP